MKRRRNTLLCLTTILLITIVRCWIKGEVGVLRAGAMVICSSGIFYLVFRWRRKEALPFRREWTTDGGPDGNYAYRLVAEGDVDQPDTIIHWQVDGEDVFHGRRVDCDTDTLADIDSYRPTADSVTSSPISVVTT